MPYRRISDPRQLHALIAAILLIEADVDLPEVLRAIVATARDLSGARYGALGVVGERHDELVEFVTSGLDEGAVGRIGAAPVGRGLLGVLLRDARAVRLADVAGHPEYVGFPAGHPEMRSFLGVPIFVVGDVFGSLYLCDKEGGGEFTSEDEDIVAALAVAAGLAIDKARLHGRLRTLTLSEERERIARDLHETVIQRLFAVGLELQSTVPLVDRPEARGRLEGSIADLDDTIRHIRSTIFAVNRPLSLGDDGVRGEVVRVIDEVCAPLGLDVRVDLDGPLDAAVGAPVAEHLLFSLREALAGAARRAPDGKLEVDIWVDDRGLTLRVADDGVPRRAEGRRAEGRRAGTEGPPRAQGRGSSSLKERARLFGGTCVERDRSPGPGTELVWHVAQLR